MAKIQVNITGRGDTSYCYVTINGTKYTDTTTLEIEAGTEISVYATSNYADSAAIANIELNGITVASGDAGEGASYSFTPDAAVVNININQNNGSIPLIVVFSVSIATEGELETDSQIYTVTITGAGSKGFSYITINGTDYYSPTTLTVAKDTSIFAYIIGGQILLNGENVATTEYTFALTNDATINLYMASTQRESYIEITMDEDSPDSGNGYTLLEYIESTGTQYIDTGFVPNQDTRVVMDFEYTKVISGTQQGVFGARVALRDAMFLMWTENDNAGWRDGYGAELEYPLGPSISGRNVVDKNKNVLSVNGAVTHTATYETFNSNYSLYLLTTNNGGSPMIDSYPTYARIYSCQIYDNGILVRDFVPAKRDSDGTIGLYDSVNNTFYGNAGSGSFTAGLPDGFTQLDYIQSSGTQYIDTGFNPSNTTRVIADFQCLSGATNDPTVFGAWSGWTTNAFLFLSLADLTSGHGFFEAQMASYTKDMTARHTVDANGTNWTMDGESLLSFTEATYSCSYPLYLFAYNDAGNAGNLNAPIRIYSCSIYDNGTLVRDFVPMLRDSDSVAGLYDTVNGVFYTNAGTGVFFYAGYIEPAGAHNTLLDGTAYAITGGKTMVGGTVYGVSSGKTMVDGTVYDISFGKPVTLQNLITDDNFSNRTWWTASNASYTVSGNIATVTPTTSGTWPILYRDPIFVTKNHMYYACVNVKHSNTTTGARGARVEFKQPDIDEPVYSSEDSVLGSVDWQLRSVIGTLNFTRLNLVLALPNSNTSGSPIRYQTTQFTEAMLIDLTAAFGAGNEPTKEECDEMIDYFSGSTTILWR